MNNIKQEKLILKDKEEKSHANNIILKVHKTDKKQINITDKNCKSLTADTVLNTEQLNIIVDNLLYKWNNTQIKSLDDYKKLRNEINNLVSMFVI
ncbi:MAG: hypothetical protein HY934_08965 [Candidatus Firestonebacteria bacterium]|nr:hypothetical protein [Candidatus Firestonebacteria bacterium]